MAEPVKLQFRPGINRETTDYGNTGGWYDGNLVRFRTGTPESIGGWQRFTVSPALGTFRSLFPWSTLSGSRYYGTGTNLKYYILRGNQPVDITPIRRTVTLANNPFATTLGSTTVTVTDTANGSVLNDFVTFSGSTAVGGVPAADLNMEHQITEIIDPNTYTITVATAATSATNGGGAAVSAAYQINVGLDTTVLGNGWGTGGWGMNGWGTGSSVFIPSEHLRLWTEDNYGEDLLFNPRDGGVYFKDMSFNVADRGVNITSLTSTGNVPIIARQVLVSDNDRHVLAFATNTIDTVVQDRLLLRWSDAEDLLNWTPDTTNSAGSLRIEGGSEFLKATETTTETLVFTDITLHSLRFIGPPFTFGITRLASNVQLIAPNAVVSTGAETFWMANGLFQMYDGVVRDMPCDIRAYVFSILNSRQSEKITAGANRRFKEVVWLMPVNDATENNFYVICNYENPGAPIWYYGSFNEAGRTAWLDAWFEATPLAGSPDGYIYAHDVGASDGSDTGGMTRLNAYLKSSVFELSAGGDFMLISRLIPDLDFTGSTGTAPEATFTFEARDYPGSDFTGGPTAPTTASIVVPVPQYTEKIDRRLRARSVQFGIETSADGTLWQLGAPRVYMNPDGQR